MGVPRPRLQREDQFGGVGAVEKAKGREKEFFLSLFTALEQTVQRHYKRSQPVILISAMATRQTPAYELQAGPSAKLLGMFNIAVMAAVTRT